MKGILVIFMLLGLPVLLCAQTQALFTIRGQVVDEESGEPLAYATAVLVKFPIIEQILKGVVTNQDGKFELKAAKRNCALIIRNLGYRNFMYELNSEMPEILDLGIIRLKVQPEQLGLVTVKPLVEVSVDEIKYNLLADPDRETASLHAILDKVPMIHRSPAGELYVDEPNKKFMVVRNGKVDALFAGNLNDILKALPAKGFASVTVLLAPPERYGEYDYVVSIETDKTNGLYGAVGFLEEMNTVNKGRFDSKANVVVSLDKLRMSLAGLFQNTNAPPSKQLIYKKTTEESDVFQQRQKNEVSGEKWGAGGVFSYDFSKQHFLTWKIGHEQENQRDKSELKSGYTDKEVTTTSYIDRRQDLGWGGGLDYQYDIGTTGQVLNVAYSFQLSPIDRQGYGDGFTSEQIERQTQEKQQEQVLQLHYYRPVGQHWKLETGGGYLYRYYFSKEVGKEGNLEGDPLLEDLSLMEVRKHIVNAYLKIDYRRKRFSAGVEMKADYLNDGEGTEIVLPDRKEKISETSLNLMPNVRLSWLFPKCKFSRFALEYQLRHLRPSFRMLSTHEDVSNADYIQVGNPNLKSEKKHNLRMSTWVKRIGISFSWSYSGDKIGTYWYLDESGRTIHTYDNYGYSSSYFLSSNYSHNWKGIQLAFMLGGGYDHEEVPSREKQRDWKVNSLCSVGYTFKNQINAGLNLGYNEYFTSGYSSLQMPAWSLAIWGRKKLFRERVELEIHYANLTRFDQKIERRINADNFRMYQCIKQNNIPLTVKLSWRIGSFKLKPIRNIRKSVVVDDILEE